jgi:Ca2+-binding RTX toxin-like protein
VLRAHGGNDSFTASGDLASLIALTVDGGSGNDRITGGNGNDTLIGGAGNDVIDGKQGDDKVFLGFGDDSFQWDPGDGSDTVEGQAGHDSLLFNGASGPENIDLSTNGARVRLVRDVGKVTMDLNGLEALRVNALAGDDIVDAHALTSGLTSLTLDGGDGNDQLIGSAGNDVLLGGNGDDKLVGGPGQDVLDGGTGSNVLIR